MATPVDLLLASPPSAVTALLPDIGSRRPAPAVARRLIDSNPRLLPVAIHPGGDGADVYWVDLAAHDTAEWQQVFDLEAAVAAGHVGDHFATSLDVLDRPPPDALEPSGFVFHMSRCGSTAVSRALARSPRHLVHSQPGILRDGVWSLLTDGWRRAPTGNAGELRLFRNLLDHLLRPASSLQSAAFVKLYSENVLFLDFVRAAYPRTPSLFLFREPAEVLASVARNGTGMLSVRGTAQAALTTGLDPRREAALDDLGFLVRCFARYFEVVLGHRPGAPVTVLEHRDLDAGTFPTILADALDHRLHPDDHQAVLAQFGWHSKSDDGRPRPYADDSQAKRAALPAGDRQRVDRQLGPLVERLRDRAWTPARSRDA